MPETKSKYGAAQPIADVANNAISSVKKMLGVKEVGAKPVPSTTSSTNAGKLPSAWEKANATSIEQAKARRQAQASKRYK